MSRLSRMNPLVRKMESPSINVRGVERWPMRWRHWNPQGILQSWPQAKTTRQKWCCGGGPWERKCAILGRARSSTHLKTPVFKISDFTHLLRSVAWVASFDHFSSQLNPSFYFLGDLFYFPRYNK